MSIGDPDRKKRARIARRLERENPGWVVLWAPWRQKFTAFTCWLPTTCVIVEAAETEILLNQMRQVEVEAWATRQPPPEPA